MITIKKVINNTNNFNIFFNVNIFLLKTELNAFEKFSFIVIK